MKQGFDSRPDHEKHIILLMDEIHIKEDLVYDHHGSFEDACMLCSIHYNNYMNNE